MADGADIQSTWLQRTEQVDGLDLSFAPLEAWLLGVPITGTGSATAESATASASGNVSGSSGAVTAGAATVSASGSLRLVATGAMTAESATVSADGAHTIPNVTGTAAVTAQAASVTATGIGGVVAESDYGAPRRSVRQQPRVHPAIRIAGRGLVRARPSIAYATGLVNDDDLALMELLEAA